MATGGSLSYDDWIISKRNDKHLTRRDIRGKLGIKKDQVATLIKGVQHPEFRELVERHSEVMLVSLEKEHSDDIITSRLPSNKWIIKKLPEFPRCMVEDRVHVVLKDIQQSVGQKTFKDILDDCGLQQNRITTKPSLCQLEGRWHHLREGHFRLGNLVRQTEKRNVRNDDATPSSSFTRNIPISQSLPPDEKQKRRQPQTKFEGEISWQRFTCRSTNIQIGVGDITKLNVDSIVNAATSFLRPSGGVAGAISKAAGNEMDNECQDIIKNKGPLPPGHCVMTAAGKLPCKHIIHTVGPDTCDYKRMEVCTAVLKEAYARCLEKATEQKFTSMAMLDISAGIYGVPKANVSEALCEVLQEFCNSKSELKGSLKTIYLVDFDQQFLNSIKERLSNDAGFIKLHVSPRSTDTHYPVSSAASHEPESYPQARNIPRDKRDGQEDARPSSSFERNIPRTKSLTRGEKQKRGQPQTKFEGEISWQCFTGRSINIQVGVGDITKLNVDAIVNAANSFLQHSGGVAGAISKAAGKEMDTECHDFIKKKGPLPSGHCVMTAAGKLPCKHIIHTVGPRKSDYKRMEECTAVLKEAYARCLEKATEEKLTSMAMPAVSAGIYGVPKAQVSEALCAVLQEFCNSKSGLKGSLETIYLVDIDKQVINSIKERLSNSAAFIEIHVSPQSTANPRDRSHRKSFAKRFRDSIRSRKRTRGPPTKHDDLIRDGQEDARPSSSFERNIPRTKSLTRGEKQKKGQPQTKFEGEISWQRFTCRSTNIQVGVGDITILKVDAIVNDANSFLRHSGGVAGAISKAAGKEMDNECHDFIKKKGPLPPVHCVMTAAGKLPCKHIIHTVGPRKSDYKRMEECTAVLKEAYARCLEKATEEKLTSMAMPAVSAGIYGVPKAQVSEALCAVLQEFCNSKSGLKGSLETIYLVDIDKQVINSIKERLSNSAAFIEKHVSPQSTANPRDRSHRKSFAKRIRDSFRSRKRTRGPPTEHDDLIRDGQEVGVGDITKLKVDAIVNDANSFLRHSGGVAGAISKAAGKEMDNECHDFIKKKGPLPPGHCVMTAAGKLPCKHIIHTVGPRKSDYKRMEECTAVLKEAYARCLEKATEEKLTSMAMPAVSAGIYGVPKAQVSEALCAVLQEFCNSKSGLKGSLETIYLVDIDKQVINSIKERLSNSAAFIEKHVSPQSTANPRDRSHRKSFAKRIRDSFRSRKRTRGPPTEHDDLIRDGQEVEDRVNVVLKEPDIQRSVAEEKFRDILNDCGLQQNRITTKPSFCQLEGRWHHLREGHYRLGNLVRQPKKVNVRKSKEYEDAMPSSSFKRNIPRTTSLTRGEKQKRGQPQTKFEGEISWQRFKCKSTNIQVGVGDITKLKVDAIVNAANSYLQHSGGVAGAISKAAGKEMDYECHDFIKKNGPLPPGHCVMTAAGKLPCKHIIHTVGPRQSEYKRMEECTGVLKEAYARCLEKAAEEKLTSMAMPAVSAGIYGVPKAQVSEALCAVLQEFCNSKSGLKGSLETIYLVDIDKQVINSMKQSLSKHADFIEIQVSPQYRDNPRDKNRKSFRQKIRESFRKKKRTNVNCQEVFGTTTAEIKEEVANILSRGHNNEREKIPVRRRNSNSYIEASWVDFAGLVPELQNYSYTSNLNNNDSDILKYLKRFRLPITKFENENKVKYFEWNEANNTTRLTLCGAEKKNVDNAKKGLKSLYQDLHQNLQSEEMDPDQPITEFTDKSEAITSIENQYKCIITKKPNGKIHMCGPKNRFAAFQVELSKQMKQRKQIIPRNRAVGQVSISPNFNQPNAAPINATNNAPTTLFLSPEEIYIKISVGDITALNLDVIVNAADQYMEHGGGVSKSISKAAGKKMREECEKHIKMYGPVAVGTTLVTTGGNLTCKKVIHAVGPRWSDYDRNNKTECLHMLHDTYLRCLHQARPYETIALPAISAGTFGIPKGKVSDTLLKAVDSFCKENTGKLQTIQIIDIDEAIIKKIRDKFQKAERYTLQHIFVRGGGQPQISRKAKKRPAIANDQFEEPARLVSTARENNVSVHFLPNTPKADQAYCVICLDTMKHPKQLHLCKHTFCRDCIDRQFKIKPMCPVCGKAYGVIQGNQPDGKMEVSFTGDSIPGYEGSGSIVITYTIPSGIQTDNHPNPGVPYTGTIRRAYLPRNAEGRKVLSLLRKAFDARLIFTVGTSHTQYADNVVTWNDIHHKTSVTGGSSNFGYPDPGYLKRVQDELAAKGIVSSDAN